MNKLDESRGGIVRSAVLIGVWTGCSRLLGLLREVLMARFFGTALVKSAFDAAFRIPNLFRRLFGEGALSAAFVPIFTKSIKEDGIGSADKMGGRMVSLLSIILGTIVVVGILLISAAIPSFPEESRAGMLLSLLRIMLPYTLCICLAALCMGMLNSVGHFAVPALTPVLLNVVWIVTLILICPFLPVSLDVRIRAVAWGIVVAGVVQLAVQVPALIRFGLRPWPRGEIRGDPRIRRVMTLMAPAALGLGVVQLNVCLDGLLALIAAPWAAAALTYSERLVYLPLGLFATALGTVLLPTMSGQTARDDSSALLRTVRDALCSMMLVMLPAAAGLMVLGGGIVQLIYLGGEFTELSAVQTTRALLAYAPGLLVFSLYKVFAPAFYAMQDTRTPVRVSVWMVILNVSLNVLSILYLPVDFRHCGIAFATVLCSALSCVILAVIMHRRLGDPGWGRVFVSGGKTLLASGIMAVSVWGVFAYMQGLGASGGRFFLGVSVGAAMGAGVGVYGAVSLLLHGWSVVVSLLKRRRRG